MIVSTSDLGPFGSSTSHQYQPPTSSNSTTTSYSCNTPALDSAVDAYASRLLRLKSPQEAIIDPCVGPYVTSIIRSSLSNDVQSSVSPSSMMFSLESLPEYDSLLELVQEHCGMNPEVARDVLASISLAVRTGVVHDCDDNHASWNGSSLGSRRRYHSNSIGNEFDYGTKDIMKNWNQMLRTSNSNCDAGINSAATPSWNESNGAFSTRDQYPASDDNCILSSSLSDSENSNDDAFKKTEKKDTKSSSVSKSPVAKVPMMSPMKPDNLIPVDLLGSIDDSSVPISIVSSTADIEKRKLLTVKSLPIFSPESQSLESANVVINDFPIRNQYDDKPSSMVNNTGKGKGKKSKSKATDIAALLFKSPRSRSNSVQEYILSPKQVPLPSMNMSGIAGLSLSIANDTGISHSANVLRLHISSAAQYLVSMNLGLCEEAANDAAMLCNADANLAQHLIGAALSAPPVCRHMLNDGCYRSDCQFSHDVEGYTCTFWLKGRCGKGDSCRFMHGFSPKLLEMVNADNRLDYCRTPGGIVDTTIPCTSDIVSSASHAIPASHHSSHHPIKTANLVQHNLKNSLTLPSRLALNRTSSHELSNMAHCSIDDSTAPSLSHSLMSPPMSSKLSAQNISNHEMDKRENHTVDFPSLHFPGQSNTDSRTGNANSTFASVASQGYSEKSFFIESYSNDGSSSDEPNMFVRIPQELWNANHNRTSSAFYIADPIERYLDVSSSVSRSDVIDLHFQSIRTFPIVLSRILPEKLSKLAEVWIVSGSGHHVNRTSHQKSGGVLDTAVIDWLITNEYKFVRGKDKNGFGGAVLVRR